MLQQVMIGGLLLWSGINVAFSAPAIRDTHSYANPEAIRVRHLDLDLQVDFEKRVLHGTATLQLNVLASDRPTPLVLDSKGLTISEAEASTDGSTFSKTTFELGKADATLGQKLTVKVPAGVKAVRIHYSTGLDSTALQWLSPQQTAGKRHPYLFTQSQAIDARSWIPLQDTPQVRITYSARIRTPKGLRAVMSAGNDPKQPLEGDFRFEMKQAIPAYLIALAVGDIDFRPLGKRTGVYAEPSVIAKAANEFADIEEMMRGAETLYGPYRWDRYDVLVMPPSFPFGGMENPRLTFASPTILAGDKSLVSVLAHELAHSWSGNLVSNATWSDFWLNEGFTVYLERRIMEKVYGKVRADVENVLGRRSLDKEMAELPKKDQILHVDLSNRAPVEGLTDVAYEKGALFLKHLEEVYGRDKLDAFLKGYFDHFAFQSITTPIFAEYLKKHLLDSDPSKATFANVDEWLYQPGIPKDSPSALAASLNLVEKQAEKFVKGEVAAGKLQITPWNSQEWLHFLNSLPKELTHEQMKALDESHHLTDSGNSEVIFAWLMLAIQKKYEPAYKRLESFLTEQGRRKFLKPLYAELVKTPAGKERATAIYQKARTSYHPVSIETIDGIVGWKK
jgi:leukotriene-A4 hydrolase